MKEAWEQRVKDAVKQQITDRVLAAFNTNIDVVVHLDGENMKGLLSDPAVCLAEIAEIDLECLGAISSKNDFVAVLKDCLGKGKSHYVVLEDMSLLAWLEEKFVVRKESLGGQAGIIANQMAALGATSAVYTPLLSEKQASMFFPEVRTPVVRIDDSLSLDPVQESTRPDGTKINWIFEYPKNASFFFEEEEIITPRANRVILATRPEGADMTFKNSIRTHLPGLGETIDVAFMAGYHYAPSDKKELEDYLTECIDCLRGLKAGNPSLMIHFEYVPMKDQEAEKIVLKTIGQEIQSFGINENEIKRVLDEFGFEKEYLDIENNERAYALYQGALRLKETLGFTRIHVHNLGYYIIVLDKEYPVPLEKVTQASLYASAVNAIKARDGGYVAKDKVGDAVRLGLSPIGLEQLQGFAKELEATGISLPADFLSQGVVELWDHSVLFVPAHVVANPVSTVGMGDTISSASYSCEFSK